MNYFLKLNIMIFFMILSNSHISDANASSPGMIEGPPGCTWDSTVTKVENDSEPKIYVKLEKEYGSCVYGPCPSGKTGDLVTVSIKNKGDIEFKEGDSVKVWVALVPYGSLEHPGCERVPIPADKSASEIVPPPPHFGQQ